jgi:hypothetical protein
VALIGALGATFAWRDARAADQRYEIEACGGAMPCAFVLDTQTGETRYCDTAGCKVLDAVGAAEKPSPFPFGNQMPGITSGQGTAPVPRGEMSSPEPSLVDRLNRVPATGAEADGPSPFPYIEPVPRGQ